MDLDPGSGSRHEHFFRMKIKILFLFFANIFPKPDWDIFNTLSLVNSGERVEYRMLMDSLYRGIVQTP